MSVLQEAQKKLDSKSKRRDVQKTIDEAPARPARSYDAADLVAMDMADPNYIVRPYVAEGVTLVCGRPKMGKTTLLRQLAMAVNTAGQFFSAACTRVPVVFLSLEEGERIMRKKFKSGCARPEALRGIRLEFEWPQGLAGVKQLRELLQEMLGAGEPALVIVDSLTRFRIPPSERGNAFTEDYNTVKLLADLCKEFPGLAVLVLHHTTKATPDDPVSAISGTYGLTAAADNFLILLKQGQQYRLHAGGRLWEGDASDFELRREDGGWSLIGEWDGTAPQGLTPKQQAVLAALKDGAKTNKTLGEITGQSPSALAHLLGAMSDRGLVSRVANGWEIVR
jgi:RecA-family ATPase